MPAVCSHHLIRNAAMLLFGFHSINNRWICLDTVSHKAACIAMMHEAFDDCLVRIVRLKFAFWAMRMKFAEASIPSDLRNVLYA